MDLTFIDYEINDSEIRLHFSCSNPGAGKDTEYYVSIADTELASYTTVLAFSNAIKAKLARKLKAQGIATILDQFKGRSVTI